MSTTTERQILRVEIVDPQSEHHVSRDLVESEKAILVNGTPFGNIAYVDHNGYFPVHSYCWSWGGFPGVEEWREHAAWVKEHLHPRDGEKTEFLQSFSHPSVEAAIQDFIARVEMKYTNVLARYDGPTEPALNLAWEWRASRNPDDGYQALLRRGIEVAKVVTDLEHRDWTVETINFDPAVRLTGCRDETQARVVAEAWVRYHETHPSLLQE